MPKTLPYHLKNRFPAAAS